MTKRELFIGLVAFLIGVLEASEENIDIKAVDRNICEVLKKPTDGNVKEESGLMKNLQRYYEYLDNINDRIDRRWREEANVKRMLETIGKEGPQMVNVTIDSEAFKKAYEWDDDDVDTMKTTILGIKYMWDQVTRRTKFLSSKE
uniref:Uncharacterized protein n=1 Tax=Cuerna arida TaxID=1464854 RepID=A0A1B6FWE8_9HEMI